MREVSASRSAMESAACAAMVSRQSSRLLSTSTASTVTRVLEAR